MKSEESPFPQLPSFDLHGKRALVTGADRQSEQDVLFYALGSTYPATAKGRRECEALSHAFQGRSAPT